MPFMWVWLRLTIMKLASRKNMMSINGMISIRACFFGMGDRIFMALFPLVLRPAHGEGDRSSHLRHRPRFKSPPSERARRRVIQNRTARALRHLRARHGPASRINAHDTHATAGGLGSARFVRIFRTRSADGDCFR